MKKTAFISECGKYRYELSRVWNENLPMCMFIMLNPSTADADNDDPTIRRCIQFAKDWGYGGIYVGNLYGYRTFDPKELKLMGYPMGFYNASSLRKMASLSELIICAWGGNALKGNTDLSRLLSGHTQKLHYLKKTKSGEPCHPLYLRSDLKPIQF